MAETGTEPKLLYKIFNWNGNRKLTFTDTGTIKAAFQFRTGIPAGTEITETEILVHGLISKLSVDHSSIVIASHSDTEKNIFNIHGKQARMV